MKCEEFADLLSPLLDGRLGEAEVRALEEHREGCESCQTIYSEYQALERALRNIPDERPVAVNPFELVNRKRILPSFGIARFALPALLVLVMVIAGVFLVVRGPAVNEHRTAPQAGQSELTVELNDECYRISVSGEEVRLVSIQIQVDSGSSVYFDMK
jgi:predicted anti-sigma-YlaC factor YlaD